MKKSKISTIFISIIGIAVIIFTVKYFIDMSSGNLEARQNQKEIKSINKEISKNSSEKLKPEEYYDESKIYDIMHRMTNSKIIAKDGEVWGRLPMLKSEIESLRNIIEEINYSDRNYLLEVLSRWEEEDFSNSVEEHNYFWKKLGGTIGEAYKLKE